MRDRKSLSVMLVLAIAAIASAIVVACGDSDDNATSSSDASTDGSNSRDAISADGASDGGSDASRPGPCAPNATESCSCATGTGISQCSADGKTWSACVCESYGLEIAVSPTGSDDAGGTLGAPFKTIARANTAVKAAVTSGLPANGVVVWLRDGNYFETQTLTMDATSSGTAASEITWSGYPGENAVISGGTAIDPGAFSVVANSSPVYSRLDPSVQGKVVSADLNALGITNFGTVSDTSPGIELFVDGAAMTLARWPDVGDVSASTSPGFTTVATTASSTTFTYSDTRAARWLTASDARLHGMFGFDWWDDHEAISSINTASKTITIAAAPTYGITAAQPYYAENLLEEITVPGEWYLDRTAKILYFYPPSALAGKRVVASTLAVPVVTMMGGATNITLRDLTIEASQTDLIKVTASSNLKLTGLTLRNGGGTAANIASSTNVAVSHAVIHDLALDGVAMNGGSRITLTAASYSVDNSDIYDYAQWKWDYRAAVNITGDGTSVTHNRIHSAPHNAILWEGNNHTINLNEIFDVCRFTGDAGAIYSGRDLTARGNTINNNYLHDIVSLLGPTRTVSGVYLDDQLSGEEVRGNIIDHVVLGILNGGGRDNLVDNNIVAHSSNGAVYSDARGFFGGPMNLATLVANLGAMPYQTDPWASAYPKLAVIPDDGGLGATHWMLPEGVSLSRNVGFGNTAFTRFSGGWDAGGIYMDFANNEGDASDVFTNEDAGDLSVAATSGVRSIPGFVAPPFSTIGIQP